MQETEVVLGVLRERGRKGLPCTQLYRQMSNRDLYLTAYGNIYSNQGAMTPGASEETADGMSEGKIEQIIGLMRNERYRFSPARRIYIPKKNGRLRPLGLPSWSDKLVGEVVRLLLEAIYEPQFSRWSHGFRRNRGCHTALRDIRSVIQNPGSQGSPAHSRILRKSCDTPQSVIKEQRLSRENLRVPTRILKPGENRCATTVPPA